MDTEIEKRRRKGIIRISGPHVLPGSEHDSMRESIKTPVIQTRRFSK